MHRKGHLYYYYLKKQSPAKRLIPQVNATWVESNAAQTKTEQPPTQQAQKQEASKTSTNNFWDIEPNINDDYYQPLTTNTKQQNKKDLSPFWPAGLSPVRPMNFEHPKQTQPRAAE